MITLRLVQGPKSARALLADVGKNGAAAEKWVCLDASAEPILRKVGIVYGGQDLYISQSQAALIDEEAYRISGEWYRDFELPLSRTRRSLRSESFIRREFNYCVQGALRAFSLLEGIRRVEGTCRIVWEETPQRPGIRLGRDESFVGALLETYNNRWGFECVKLVSEGRSSSPKKIDPVFMRRALLFVSQFMTSSRGTDEIWFHGNPGLLGPVKKELEGRGRPCRRLRVAGGWRQLLKGILAKEAVFVPAFSRKRRLDPEQAAVLRRELLSSKALLFCGVSLAPVLLPKITAFYGDRVAPLKPAADALEKMLSARRPRLIILDEDVTEFGAMLSETASVMGIPCLTVVHGVPGKPLGSVPSRSARIACWGEHDREQLIRWGVSPDKLVITGCPKYAAYKTATPETRRAQKIALGLEPDLPVVLIAPTSVPVNGLERFQGVISNPDERLRLLSNFFKIGSLLDKCRFVLKFHGGLDDPALIDNALEKAGLEALPANFTVVRSGSAIPWIEASDRVVSLYSSILLEAVLLGTPVWIANFSEWQNIFALENERTRAWHLRTYEEAFRACQRLSERTEDGAALLRSQSGSFERFCQDPAQAALRIADLAEDLLSTAGKNSSAANHPLAGVHA